MAKVLCISNIKGGVGKTTSAVSIAAGLSKRGFCVLLIDMDLQANATQACGQVDTDHITVTIATIMNSIINDKKLDPKEGIIHHAEGFDLIPSSVDLVNMELYLVNVMGREFILREYINMITDLYDFIILDCMPYVGMVTINAFACADSILIPVQPAFFSVKGLEILIGIISKVKRQLNPKLVIEGILITMVNRRSNFGKEVIDVISDIYGSSVNIFSEYIPLSVKATETAAEGVSIFSYSPKGQVARSYDAVIEEVLNSCQ